MHKTKNAVARKVLSCLLALMLLGASLPDIFIGSLWAVDSNSLSTVQPILLVTGGGLPDGARGSAASVSNERSYTLADLQALSFQDTEKMGGRIKKVYDKFAENYTQYNCGRVFREDLVKFREIIFEKTAETLEHI